MEPIKYTTRERLNYKKIQLQELRNLYPVNIPTSFMEIELNLIIDSLNIQVEMILEKINNCKEKLIVYKQIIDDIV